MKMQRENRKRPGDGKLGKYSGQFKLLVERAKEYGFEIPSFQPRADQVVVWRLPPITTTPGGLHIVEEFESPNVKGVLVAWGPKAMDSLSSEGYDLGHIVIFKRFAGFEHNDSTPEAFRACRILQLHASDIGGSDDLRQMLESGRATYVKGADGRHSLSIKQISDKKAKILKLAADPAATPAERATAQKIAAKL